MTNTNKVSEFSHVGIQVRDLSVSLPFYRDQIGMEVVTEWLIEDEHTREAVDLPEASLNMALLRLPGTNAFMEVIEYRNVDRKSIDPYHPNPGTCHIAWYVDDIDELYHRLVAQGLEPVSRRVVPIKSGPLKGGKVIYMTDPDGIRIEFLESDFYLDTVYRFTT